MQTEYEIVNRLKKMEKLSYAKYESKQNQETLLRILQISGSPRLSPDDPEH